MAMPWKLEMREDSVEILRNFYYLGDVISFGGGVESVIIGDLASKP